MGGKTRETTVINQETTPKPTAEETELNKLELERVRATQPGQIETQTKGLELVNQLLAGKELPGYLGDIGKGVSTEEIGTQAASLAESYQPGFQRLGIGDSGVAYRETARGIANELLFPAAQFNVGAKQNLLNLAFGGQAQVQQPIVAGMGNLQQQLAGLRSEQMVGQNVLTRPRQQSYLWGLYGSS